MECALKNQCWTPSSGRQCTSVSCGWDEHPHLENHWPTTAVPVQFVPNDMTLLTWLSRLQSWLHKHHELCLSTLRCIACRHQTPMLMPVITCPSNVLATLRHAHSSTWPRIRSSKTCHHYVWSVVFLMLHQRSTSIRAVHRITRNNKSWYFLYRDSVDENHKIHCCVSTPLLPQTNSLTSRINSHTSHLREFWCYAIVGGWLFVDFQS